MRRGGVLINIAENDPELARRTAAFRKAPREAGWTEGDLQIAIAGVSIPKTLANNWGVLTWPTEPTDQPFILSAKQWIWLSFSTLRLRSLSASLFHSRCSVEPTR